MISTRRTSERFRRRPCVASSSGRGHEILVIDVHSSWQQPPNISSRMRTALPTVSATAPPPSTAECEHHQCSGRSPVSVTGDLLLCIALHYEGCSSRLFPPRSRGTSGGRGCAIRDEHGQPAAHEPVEVTGPTTSQRQQLRRRGAFAVVRCAAMHVGASRPRRLPRYTRSWRAGTKRQIPGNGTKALRPRGSPGVRGAERDRARDEGELEGGTQQVDLLGAGRGRETEQRGMRTAIAVSPSAG